MLDLKFPPGFVAALQRLPHRPNLMRPMWATLSHPVAGIQELRRTRTGRFAHTRTRRSAGHPSRRHVLWPRWALDVLAPTTEDLRRMARLGLTMYQHVSDLIRTVSIHRESLHNGGTGLCAVAAASLFSSPYVLPMRWNLSVGPRRTSTRWKAPGRPTRRIVTFYSRTCAPYTETSLRARWRRWLGSEAGLAVCKKWWKWLTEQIAEYEWDIDLDVTGPIIHGLRATRVSDCIGRRMRLGQISNDIRRPRQMVDHYNAVRGSDGRSCRRRPKTS